ncbi:flippase [Enterococcus faecium]|uniref:flippase n=1 Tax=Enterococcus faecium TaxID=1352 RepID=UPI00288E6439|nr:flippase [Enterococcus faecium]MDT2297868.1 flippase [Enterococcus faecium]
MKTTNKNFMYNIVYQIFIFIIPLISTPYISRALGVENVGIYSYTYSIVYYFMLCGLIGINNYGSRKIAKSSDDKEKMSENFINIYCLQFILTSIMIAAYYIYIFFMYRYNLKIMLIQSIFLLSVLLDINWFFFGIEKFKITISRNIIIKVLSLILTFVFVKDSNDLWKYTLLMSGSTFISQAYLWLYIKKYIKFSKPSFKEIMKNLNPCLILFIPIIAYSIYRVMDKTMIGMFSNTIELGNYESAEKIINIPISFITALGTVMLPHMSKTNDKEYERKIMDTFRLTFFFIMPMCFGTFLVSSDFSTIFFGKEFEITGNIIKLLIPTVIFTSIANVIRTSYLIPKEKDNIYVYSTIIGAAVNLVLNLIFIRKYGAYGACIGTIVAEFFVMLYQIVCTKNFIDYKKVVKIFMKYLYKSMAMALIIIVIGCLIKNIYLKLLLQVFIAVLVYFCINFNYIKYDFLGKEGSVNNFV